MPCPSSSLGVGAWTLAKSKSSNQGLAAPMSAGGGRRVEAAGVAAEGDAAEVAGVEAAGVALKERPRMDSD